MKIVGLNFKEVNKIRSGDSVRKFNTDLFTFIYRQDVSFGCAIVVKKKMIKLAVQRNKVRRRIRVNLCKLTHYGIKLMLISRKGFEYMGFQSICENIELFLRYISRKSNVKS